MIWIWMLFRGFEWEDYPTYIPVDSLFHLAHGWLNHAQPPSKQQCCPPCFWQIGGRCVQFDVYISLNAVAWHLPYSWWEGASHRWPAHSSTVTVWSPDSLFGSASNWLKSQTLSDWSGYIRLREATIRGKINATLLHVSSMFKSSNHPTLLKCFLSRKLITVPAKFSPKSNWTKQNGIHAHIYIYILFIIYIYIYL